MDVTYQKMRPDHLDQVAEIENQCFPTPWSRSSFLFEITQNNFAYYIVALSGDMVVGYSGMWIIMDEAHITNLAVHPGCRKKNIGRNLMLKMIRRSGIIGINRMTLEVRPSNTAARRLYESLGFEERGLRKLYYIDTNEDAIIMWNDNLAGGGQNQAQPNRYWS